MLEVLTMAVQFFPTGDDALQFVNQHSTFCHHQSNTAWTTKFVGNCLTVKQKD